MKMSFRFSSVAFVVTMLYFCACIAGEGVAEESGSSRASQSFRFRVDSNGKVVTSQKLSDLPEEMRGRIEQQIEEAKRRAENFRAETKPFSHAKTTITVIGPDGKKTVRSFGFDSALPKSKIAEAVRDALGDRSEMADRVIDRIMLSRGNANRSNVLQPSSSQLESQIQSIIKRLDQIETQLAEIHRNR